MVRKQRFSLAVCNGESAVQRHVVGVLACCDRECNRVCVCETDKWEEHGEKDSYVLGEPMNFIVSVDFVPKDRSVYIEACHVAASEESNSTQRYDVITNFG